jgi:hypothetical protein
MSERDFNMVSPAIWQSDKFAGLPTDRAKLLHFYLITNSHQNSSGGYRLPVGYAASDMRVSPQAIEEDLSALVDAGLILHDVATKEIYVLGWYQHCPPANERHAKGAKKRIEKIASDAIRETMEADFAATTWGAKVCQTAEVHPFDAANSLGQRADRLMSTSFMRGGAGR